jgi:hypothetical protein
MNGTDARRFAARHAGYAVAVVLGSLLLFALRWAQAAWRPTLLCSALLEEGLKGCLFLSLALALQIGGGRVGNVESPEFLPLLCVVGFGITENLLYFLHAPTTSIYERLVYAYPVHLNTALLYTLAFMSGRPLPAVLAALTGTAYHFGLNVASLVAPRAAVLGIGAANLLAFAALFLRVHIERIKRSVPSCWIPT